VFRFSLAAILALALAGATLTATVVVPVDFRQVVSESTVIVRGHVTDVRGVVVAAGGIDSVITVAVDSVIKGQADAFLSLRLPGGQVGATRMVMIGAPTLQVNQQAVFFLKPGPDNTLRPVGLSAGVYCVQPDPTTGRPVVAPPIVVGQTASRGVVVRGDPRRKLMPVQEFESLVKLVITAPAAVPRGGGGK
jgi:hypothetical protein